jgi:hypothetical protein
MDIIEVTDRGAPQGGGGLVADEGAGRTDVQCSGCHLVHSDLGPRSYVQAVEQALESSTAEVDISESGGECLGPSEWL